MKCLHSKFVISLIGLQLLGCSPTASQPSSASATPVAISAERSEEAESSDVSFGKLPDKPAELEVSVKEAVLSGQYVFNDTYRQKSFESALNKLIDAYEFQELEQLAKEYRKSSDFSPGYPSQQITSYYYILKTPTRGHGVDLRLTRLLDWAKKRPKSIEPRIAALRLLCESHRGGVGGGGVQNIGGQLLQKPLLEAGKVFDSLSQLKDDAYKEPEYFAAALEYLSLTEGDPAEAEQLFQDGLKLAPNHLSLHGRYATYQRAMGRPYKPTSEDPLIQLMVEQVYLRETQVDWPTNKKRFSRILANQPYNTYLFSLGAREAIEGGDLETAKLLLEPVGFCHELYVWTLPAFLSARRKVGLPSKLEQFKVEPQHKLDPFVLKHASEETVFRSNLAHLIYLEQFEALDQIADELRSEGARFKTGESKLQALYKTFSDRWFYNESLPAHLARAERWLEQRPNSTTAKVLKAGLLVNKAWEARGGGYASSVSERGWDEFYAALNATKDLLDPLLEGPGPYDMQMLSVSMQLAVGLGLDRSFVNSVLKKAEAVDPYSGSAHLIMNNYLLERWHGKPGEREKFLKKLADPIYADLVWKSDSRVSGRSEEVQLDWQKVHRGLRTRAEEFDVIENWGSVLISAINLDDRELAAKAIADIGDRVPRNLQSLFHWAEIKRWAKGSSWPFGVHDYLVPSVTPKDKGGRYRMNPKGSRVRYDVQGTHRRTVPGKRPR